MRAEHLPKLFSGATHRESKIFGGQLSDCTLRAQDDLPV